MIRARSAAITVMGNAHSPFGLAAAIGLRCITGPHGRHPQNSLLSSPRTLDADAYRVFVLALLVSASLAYAGDALTDALFRTNGKPQSEAQQALTQAQQACRSVAERFARRARQGEAAVQQAVRQVRLIAGPA